MSDNNGAVTFSSTSHYNPMNESEARVFCSIVKNIKGKPEINWDRVAVECNFKTVEVAKTRFHQIKKKHGLLDGEVKGSSVLQNAGAKVTKAKARPKRVTKSPITTKKTPTETVDQKKKKNAVKSFEASAESE